MSVDYVAWVRRANSRWIVHHDLSNHAEAYLAHLQQTDPARLRVSCQHAYQLAQERPAGEDPKPWFYGGLFSLATPLEVRKYLSNHWLLRMVLAHASGDLAQNPAGQQISNSTLQKIKAVRQGVARMRALAAAETS